jgi:D-alanyl-lipoteichoic acid acyltransferase DltB (MBOAT superfamily)
MSWKAEYIFLILLSTVIDYFVALSIYNTANQKIKKRWLYLSLTVNFGMLFAFKYFNFFNDNAREVFNAMNLFYGIPAIHLLLPVGISFYTFQTVSYTLDVYKGRIAPETHFGKFALFVSFFPQLVAGPIERAKSLIPQITSKVYFNYDRVSSGLRLMLWGFFKKLVIADRLAIYVDTVYNDVEAFQGYPLIWATLFFVFQVYCDFSGYTDIARGAAKILGFNLVENFKFPYLSSSLTDFWRRWHISLYAWFTDYVYTPIVIDRRYWGKLGVLVAIFSTFFISGLWHGAAWTFVIWGSFHGLGLIYEMLTKKIRKKNFARLPTTISYLVGAIATFSFVFFTDIWFRANTIQDALFIIQNLSKIDGNLIGVPTISQYNFVLNFILIVFLIMTDIFLFKNWGKEILKENKMKSVVLYLTNAFLLLSILLFGVFEKQEFIYFQF